MKPNKMVFLVSVLVFTCFGLSGCIIPPDTEFATQTNVPKEEPPGPAIQTLLDDQARLDSLNFSVSMELSSALAKIDTLEHELKNCQNKREYCCDELTERYGLAR